MSHSAQSDSPLHNDLIAAIPNMRAFAISLCGNRDRADDLVQEALVKAWNHLDSFQEGTNLKAWLFTILRNAYFSELRKTKREIADSEGYHAAKLSAPPEQQGHLDLLDLNNALTKLPADQREALILVGAEGFSYEDAAAVAGCAVGTVKSRVNRARTRLNELMSQTSATGDKPNKSADADRPPLTPTTPAGNSRRARAV
ncbi:sigma-70 family RNA polymerase sigma factor [Hyphomicrobium sp. D-2]|uniref:sigma-70 family RNA polymerase sigma factor n=1 Tax=Hyphomicrobium sp. D-2 TaxID=3041621 RepID=UPI002454FFD3|nr:sigma-70 family RNA polymerase sigma factor [Hyphomicrobium sp. D-2]MDH4982008.1 sigma-70 family RNA polymerase sigma factor [Hyphomicrobium sp. D-2]